MKIVYTPKHALHDTNNLVVNGQPFIVEELPQRVELIRQALISAEIGSVVEPLDYGIAPIQAVHDPEYLVFLQEIASRGQDFYGDDRPLLPETFATRHPQRFPNHPVAQLGYYCFGTYTPVLRDTWHAAYWSAQCAITAADIVRQTSQTAYALCRPPGHHAGPDYYGGFCYLNNAAIAARFLDVRVAILDIDYHHGNGTQDIFYNSPEILYCSLHANPDSDYPYFWGAETELGSSTALGTNANFPLPIGCTDNQYLPALESALHKIKRFTPDYLVLSLGLDIMNGDPAGGFCITSDGLQLISQSIAAYIQTGIPIVIIQEGGYLLESLGSNAVQFLKNFA
jgi:acetoin utilization deacetylase AcuC-like enzyme